MIVNLEIDEYLNTKTFYTEGCDCCATYLDSKTDREEVIKHLKENIIKTKEYCKILGISFETLLT